ncbi:MAG: FKBP-type peptidyl-prolyl cis-trans isomerase [Bacteroidales bacterium]|nr:FKBP-type peptidyl-prolyl cis-trans isomerase [Bacteroidales bacterium]MBQ5574984.1 FKBP-type peptidyl-prolyl cis-trans isomerase [Bacteroidales bacterium]
MKRIIIIIAAIMALSNFATAQKYYNKVKLVTSEDSVSYCIGFLMAKNFAEQDWNFVKTDALAKAFSDVTNNKTLAIEEDRMKDLLNEYIDRIEQEQNEKAQNAEKEFLAANAQDPDVMVTESGLQYRIVKEGNGKRPSDTSGVRVHYEGKLIDGTVFDSSFDSDEPVEFNVDGLIPGMTEGLMLMSEGAEYILYIPSELGYGAFSPAEIIPAYSTLIFNVELLQVTDRIKDDDFIDYENNYRASDLDATIEAYDSEDD